MATKKARKTTKKASKKASKKTTKKSAKRATKKAAPREKATPRSASRSAQAHQGEQQKGWGIASMILGILSLLFVWAPYFGVPFAVLAIIFNAQQKKHGATGAGTAGLVTGIIGLALGIIMLILALVFISAAGGIAAFM